MINSFGAQSQLKCGQRTYTIYNPSLLPQAERLPYTLKIILENLLRHEDGQLITQGDIENLLSYGTDKQPQASEIAYHPARVLMQDFTGVPAFVDLAAMRSAMQARGNNPSLVNPRQPVELVIDHSLQVDHFNRQDAQELNTRLEFDRNRERYQFLKWGQRSFANSKVVPPGSGIVHQVNLELLARVVFSCQHQGKTLAYPDTLVGTDSHTTMVNGIGVLGWGVGGIEAEASMLGQPLSMLLPKALGFRLDNRLPEGSTATDLVLRIVEMLRQHGVVGKFVEFYGPGLAHLSSGDRCTIANMAPEYGASCGFFPVDEQTMNYLRLTNRSADHLNLVEAYCKETGLWYSPDNTIKYDEYLELDMSTVTANLAGPRRPQDRVNLRDMKEQFSKEVKVSKKGRGRGQAQIATNGGYATISDGVTVIAAITSCTNTSNPSVMLAAGLVAKKAKRMGLSKKPWVKTSLAPGSRAVTAYLQRARLIEPLQAMGFHVVGYGCTTCIGNSGPLPPEVSQAIQSGDIAAVAVLSGNRNFEGRIHAEVLMSYLASPPLVVAYAIAGRVDFDPYQEPLAQNDQGRDVFLKDLWPSHQEIMELQNRVLTADQFTNSYRDVYTGDSNWQKLKTADRELYDWPESSYIKCPPYFERSEDASQLDSLDGARALALLGDSITTDHISPAGAIKADSPAGDYLLSCGVKKNEFNSYGSRRGNHEVMARGTFANIRLRNRLLDNVEGGHTLHLPSKEMMSIYDASQRYKEEGVPLIILAGKEYGSGSSRDWAAKGPKLLGVRAVIAESYERIHRSNLVGMGILPLQFEPGDSVNSLGLSGHEVFALHGLAGGQGKKITVVASAATNGAKAKEKTFTVQSRIDTPREVEYFRSGGILPFILNELIAAQHTA